MLDGLINIRYFNIKMEQIDDEDLYIIERCRQISSVKSLVIGSLENLLVLCFLPSFNRNYISYTLRKANLRSGTIWR